MNALSSIAERVGGLVAPLQGLGERIVHVEVSGAEHLPADGAALLAVNHPSRFDRMAVQTALGTSVTWVTLPNSRRRLGQRRDRGLRAVFVEGGRSIDGKLYKGRAAAGSLMLKTGEPVLPVGIVVARAGLVPGTVQVVVGEPLDLERFKDLPSGRTSGRMAADEAISAIAALTGQIYIDRHVDAVKAARPASERGWFQAMREQTRLDKEEARRRRDWRRQDVADETAALAAAARRAEAAAREHAARAAEVDRARRED